MKVEHPWNPQPCSIGINGTLTLRGRGCEATRQRPAGTCVDVVRILSAAALIALLATGCASSPAARRDTAGLPDALARDWATQASAIAAAAERGDSCRASRLAVSLRAEVTAARGQVPERLRAPLLTGVGTLADRLSCTAQPATPTPAKAPRPKPPHEPHGHHGHHGRGGHEGDG